MLQRSYHKMKEIILLIYVMLSEICSLKLIYLKGYTHRTVICPCLVYQMCGETPFPGNHGDLSSVYNDVLFRGHMLHTAGFHVQYI